MGLGVSIFLIAVGAILTWAVNASVSGLELQTIGVTTLDDGQQLAYTLVQQVNLTQSTPVKAVPVDWNQDSDYQSGTYTIDLYNEGFRIGGGSVTLR